jgi:multiple sugar transport system permease protein
VNRARFNTSEKWIGFLYISPIIVLLFIFIGIPTIRAFYYSFTVYDGITDPIFRGFNNYKVLFQDEDFYNALRNNLVVLLFVPIRALIIAYILHQEVKGWKLLRSVYFMPSLVSPVIVGSLFVYILGYEGLFNASLKFFGLSNLTMDWLGDPHSALLTVLLVTVWSGFGGGMLIFLAGLSAVPKDLYEAADLDGAKSWSKFWYITVPSLKFIIEFQLVLSIIGSFTGMFGIIFVMTAGGPGTSTTVLELLIYNHAFANQNMGYASAIGIVLFLLVLGLAILQIRLMSKGEE